MDVIAENALLHLYQSKRCLDIFLYHTGFAVLYQKPDSLSKDRVYVRQRLSADAAKSLNLVSTRNRVPNRQEILSILKMIRIKTALIRIEAGTPFPTHLFCETP